MTHCRLPSPALIEDYLSEEIARREPRRRSRGARAEEASLLFPLCPISSRSCVYLSGGGTLCTVLDRPALKRDSKYLRKHLRTSKHRRNAFQRSV